MTVKCNKCFHIVSFYIKGSLFSHYLINMGYLTEPIEDYYDYDCFVSKYPALCKKICENPPRGCGKLINTYVDTIINRMKHINVNNEIKWYKDIEMQVEPEQKKLLKSLLITLTHYDETTSYQDKLQLISWMVSKINPVFKSEIPLGELIVKFIDG